jgi:HTH-type transcriptional regulator / antitoxin HipB
MHNNISEIVRFHRKRSGLTQLELAQMAGVGKTVVFDIEHGKDSVQWNTLNKVLQVLNISVQFSSPLMAEFEKDRHEKS